MATSIADTLQPLNSARDIVLRDHTLYPQVVPGIIHIIAPAAQVELRRWGADFLAETFASQVVTAEEKLQMSLQVMDTLLGYLNRKEFLGEEEDVSVVKSAVQCAASIYPFIFRHTIASTGDGAAWTKMASIKSSILRRMDAAIPGIRICCIRFVTCVVHTQTPGLIADPRRPEHNETSLALVPRDHPILKPANLEAEASGLLDRLLGVLQDNLTDALIVSATLNSLATLIHRRPSISAKILTTVFNFSPLKLGVHPLSTGDKLQIKSMTRTTMSVLINYLKRNPSHAIAGRIQQHVERLKHGLIDIFSEAHLLKRSAPDEPVDGLDEVKRQRLDKAVSNGVAIEQQSTDFASLPQGQVTLAQLWTLTPDPKTAHFDVRLLPEPAVLQLVPAIFQQISQDRLNEALSAVRNRWTEREKQSREIALNQSATVVHGVDEGGEDEDDDYDPSMGFEADTKTVDTSQNVPTAYDALPNGLAIGPFDLPAPPPLSAEERDEFSKVALTQILATLASLDKDIKVKGKPQESENGFNRLVTDTAAGQSRDGWVVLLSRLASRAPFGLHESQSPVKQEDEASQRLARKVPKFNLAQGIREALVHYVMENFRSRIGVAITWLNEEWYCDRLSQRHRGASPGGHAQASPGDLPNYWPWLLRLLNAITPYLDVKDGKVLIRLLSEIPAINRDVMDRVKYIAQDPERVQISTNTLLYLVMFRPPVRNLALDCVEQMWRENGDAKTAAKRILTKWRPAVLDEEGTGAELKQEA